MAFIFKIKIVGSAKPPIWRKVKVNDFISFENFHEIIQVLFGWSNSHLYMFSPGGWGTTPEITMDEEEFGFDDEFEEDVDSSDFPDGEKFKANEIGLNDYFSTPKQKIVYIYDFGDDWRHSIELIEVTEEYIDYPVCLGAKGDNLMENSGGIHGYYQLMEAINNPEHPEHDDYADMLAFISDDDHKSYQFDLKETNEILKEMR
ncbi:hypothetical protein GO491_05845 [Flavobacteriaceae bacterium Ap0902]|nr:hypothetical protein [Flavobacteriaceae bacterium Ap0902]